MDSGPDETDSIARMPEVMNQTGKCRSGVYAAMKAGRFPTQRKIGKRAVGWSRREIQAYIRITLAGDEYHVS